MNKKLLIILLSIGFVFIVAGSAVLIYDYATNTPGDAPVESSTDDDWTGNY